MKYASVSIRAVVFSNAIIYVLKPSVIHSPLDYGDTNSISVNEFVASPPTNYGRSNSEPNSLKSILDPLCDARRGSSSSLEPKSAPDVVVQHLTTPPSPTGTTFPSLYTAAATRPPTPPSSSLHSMSPQTSNRPSPSALYDGNWLWPSIGILPPASLAISDHFEGNIVEGLLDPQTQVDSSVNLRVHEDYPRPIGGTVHAGFNLLIDWFLP